MTTRKLPILWLALWFGIALSTFAIDPSCFEPVLSRNLRPPTGLHLLGFDAYGRDVLLITLRASIVSIGFCLAAVALSCVCALFFGTGIAVLPDRLRFAALRALDTVLAFPFLLIALSWAAVRGPGWGTLIVSLVIGILPGFTRLVYVRTRELMVEPYIQAAVSIGAGPFRIMTRHLAPMLFSLVAVKLPLLFAGTLMGEATLSFLGIGAPIGSETWGSLLAAGKDYLFEAPHIALAAGLPLTLTVLAFQILASEATQAPH